MAQDAAREVVSNSEEINRVERERIQNINPKMIEDDRHGRQRRSNIHISGGLEEENRTFKKILKNIVKKTVVK